MEHLENDVDRIRSRSGVAVTLVSSSDMVRASEVAAAFAGVRPSAPGRRVETDDEDSGDFALQLAESVCESADAGLRGETVVVLEPRADVMEIALVCEFVMTRRHPDEVPVVTREVIAVSSIREILDRFLDGAAGQQMDDAVDESAERLAARLEFASTIVLTDLEDAPGDARASLALALAQRLNPGALVIGPGGVASLRRAPLRRTETRAHRIGANMGWQLALAADDEPSSGLIGATVFRDPRPFHPGRLAKVVATELTPDRVGRILRSKGLVRLATRADQVGSWSSAGDLLSLDPTGMSSWDADSPPGQEIVFFGHHLESDRLVDVLGRCLLAPDELLAGPMEWQTYADPFPRWEAGHRH
ncbi:GTP-binding protein [Labedella endophytica]|uniref:GTP-binding protein n=1 Tax=Labedella endophytica TaxID=1523160 RepID=A0A433JX69_9MICO|nr:GTP-binding protein [Labedella endophytica]RUR03553.1 GTP-binding protein [Labedella endophytica]